MNGLILEAPGKLSLRTDLPIPEPGQGELLVRVEAATTCGTDLKAYLRGHPQIPMPGVFGHEYSGVVEAAGPGARFQVGQAVMGVHSAPCLECRWCARDQENLCESLMATKVLGSYAEYLLIPARIAHLNVFQKPDLLPFEEASLLEPLSCVAQGIGRLNRERIGRVLVLGPGAIGLMFVAVLRHLGAHDVTLVGRNADRLAIGRQFGARALSLEDLPADERFDTVVECTGSVEVWERSLWHVDRGGTLVLFGGPPTGSVAAFDTRRVHYDDLTLISPFHFGTHAVRQAREWLIDHSFDLSALITDHRPLQDAEAVFAGLRAGRDIKVVFHP